MELLGGEKRESFLLKKVFKYQKDYLIMKEDSKEVVVVALDKYSWEVLIKEKFYIFPKNTRKVGTYFAFYKGKPVSAITHYSKTESHNEIKIKEIPSKYWLMNLSSHSPPYTIVRFKQIKKLRSPIKKSEGRGRGVQGRIYTTLKKLMKSKLISELL
jgi:hypothetical protein